MDRARQLWFRLGNGISNLLFHCFPPDPDRYTSILTGVPRREQELLPILYSPTTAVEEQVKNEYGVFVSFSGEDTRRGFITHLCNSLSSDLEFSVGFKDEITRLGRGTSSSPEPLRAIKGCRLAVVVLSRSYPDSACCVEELLLILRCRKSRGLRVVPVFFDVDKFGFKEQIYSSPGEDEVRRRRRDDALGEVADLPGFATADYRNDLDMVKEIVWKIWNELNPGTAVATTSPTIINPPPLVGTDGRANAVITLLRPEDDDDVRVIGICGPAGSGKTTVAMAVYDSIRSQFESSTYIASVGAASTTRFGLLRLQKQLADEIGGETVDPATWRPWEGFERLKRAYRGKKKLLLILDGVTNPVQLLHLGVDRSFFGAGSRVIVTCREKYMVNDGVDQRVDMDCMYEIPLLEKNEARVLLCLVAFGQEDSFEDYRHVGEQILEYAGRIPSAIKVLGRFLRGRSVAEWACTVEKLKRIPRREVAVEVL